MASKVKWVNHGKRLWIITPADGGDVFCHHTAIVAELPYAHAKVKREFEVKRGPRASRPENVRAGLAWSAVIDHSHCSFTQTKRYVGHLSDVPCFFVV